jgi:glycosyltransferase involved in cell wall biosynthesis
MVVLEDAGPIRQLLSEEVSVRPLGSGPELPRSDRMKAAVPAIAEYLQTHRPKLLHAPGNHTIRPAGRAIGAADYKGLFVPKITNPLLKSSMTLWHKRRRRRSYLRALKRADLVLLLTALDAREIAALDPTLAPRSRVVHNPYISDRMIDRAMDRNPADPPIILSIGRLTEQKNHALLLGAAARLRDRPWRLRILGTGPEEESLRALALDLGITDRLELPGFVADPISEYLSAAVMALPSRWEGLPATLLEAIACGCPVVSTASSPGLVELLRNAGARDPVAPDDEAGFTQALEAALDGRLPAVSPAVTIPYGVEAACDEHAKLFADLLGVTRSLAI